MNIGDTAAGFPHLLDYDFTAAENIYLQIAASSDNSTFETLTPRTLIAASAFAQIAGAVSGTSTPSSFGTTTPIDNVLATFEASTTSAIPIAVRGAVGQTADLFQIQEGNDGLNRVIVDSGYRLGVGTSTLGGDLGLYGLGIEGAAIIGNFLTVSYINATSTTATSTFKGGINLAREAGNVGIGSSTPGSLLGVGGNVGILGRLSVGDILDVQSSGTSTFDGGLNIALTGGLSSASGLTVTGGDIQSSGKITVTSTASSSFTGGLTANYLDSATRLRIGELTSCDTIDTDASGVLKCGSDNTGVAAPAGNDFDIQFNDAGSTAGLSSLTFDKSTGLLAIGGDLAINGSDLNIGNGIFATATISGQYGKLGFGTTSPYAQFAIDPSAVSGSTTPIFVIGDSGSSSPIISINWGGVIGIGTNTPAGAEELNGFGLAIATNTLLSGTLTSSAVATNTFDGGLFVKTNGGLTSASGLTITGGQIQSSGKVVVTNAATSTFSGGLNVLTTGGLSSAQGITITGGQFESSGKLSVTNAATSTFSGGIDVTTTGGLSSAQGLTITGGGIQSSGKIVTTSSATSSIPNLNIATLLNGAALNLSGRLDSSFAATSTFAGGITANYLDSATRIRIAELTDCDTIDTDASGVLKCGTDNATAAASGLDTQVQFNAAGAFAGNSGLVYGSTNLTIGGDLAINGSDLNIGNGITATSTFSGSYGKLGLGTTSPFGQFAIEVSAVAGSNTPVFFIGDSGTSSPFLVANVNG
ncbi:MAG: hypothetical protein Q7J73_03040, partial [Dehalococcoidales bacterium]|nr:hypothetical protein [Dehalococcoidales bacterium]